MSQQTVELTGLDVANAFWGMNIDERTRFINNLVMSGPPGEPLVDTRLLKGEAREIFGVPEKPRVIISL